MRNRTLIGLVLLAFCLACRLVPAVAEASYWGFVFCRQSSNPAVRYSGFVSILPYVASNAAYLLPPEEYHAWMDTLDPKALEDYRRAGEYWDGKQVRWIERLQNWTYNLFLKSHGLSEGVKDYFGVVAMIMTMDAAEKGIWEQRNTISNEF